MKTMLVRSLLGSILLLSALAQPMFAVVVIFGHGTYPCHGLGICHIGWPDPGPRCPTVEMIVVPKSDTDLVLVFPNPPKSLQPDTNFVVDYDTPVQNPELYGYSSLTILKGNYAFDWNTNQVAVKFQGTRLGAVLFNDLGPDGIVYQSRAGQRVSGLQTQGSLSYLVANGFQASSTGSVSQIDVAIGYVSGVDSFQVSLYTDGGGIPGVLLANWSNLRSTMTFGGCCGLVAVTGISGINLTAGQNYFLVVGPTDVSSTTWGMWNLNNRGTTGTKLYSNDGGVSWRSEGTNVMGAIEIMGNANVSSPTQP